MSASNDQQFALTNAHESAGRYMVRLIPTAMPWETVATVLTRLQTNKYDAVDVLCVIDKDRRFLGLVTLQRLLAASCEAEIGTLTDSSVPSVTPDQDQETVASLALEQRLLSVPVVDVEGRLQGVVPSDALLHILRAEHIEDMNRLVGILKNGDQARNAIEGSTIGRVLNRIPWLLLGLLGSAVATWLMAGFQKTLEAQISVAFFIPAVVYLADAIGTQTEAVAVRGLTFSQLSLWQLMSGELRTGVFIGIILALFIFPSIWFFFEDPGLAFSVALAVVTAGACASVVGILLPWLLSRFGFDPAYGSGPVATILQDLLSLLTYFVTVSLFLS